MNTIPAKSPPPAPAPTACPEPEPVLYPRQRRDTGPGIRLGQGLLFFAISTTKE